MKILTIVALLLYCTVAQAEIKTMGIVIAVNTIKDTETVTGVIKGYLGLEWKKILLAAYNVCMNSEGVPDAIQPGDTPKQKESWIKIRDKCEDVGVQQADAMLKLHNVTRSTDGKLSLDDGRWIPNDAHDTLFFEVK